MSFDQLGLRPELLRAVAEQGYTIPTPVQEQAIPIVLSGKDLLAGAQTGTGKTAAFVLPILQRLHEHRPTGNRRVRVLVMTPTRELALQVEESVRIYGTYLPVRSVAIYGGVGMDAQVRAIRAGAEIVVATPGRLLDHHGQGTLRLDGVEILVLDEADRMLDMGFIHDIKKVLALLPRERQSLLFSATFSPDIRALAERLLRSPQSVDVAPRNSAAELVTQVVHPVDRSQKRALLSHLVRSRRIHQALVFTRTKHGANRLAEQLQRDGIEAMAIHGNKSQGARVRALSAFKDGGAQVLVATDIAARGIDIDQLPHVVNYELPNVPEDYVHRIGRTGRAGAGGTAVSLVSADEALLLRDIEKLLKTQIAREVVDGFAPDPARAAQEAADVAAEARETREFQTRGRGGRGGRGGAPRSDGARSAGARGGSPRPAARPAGSSLGAGPAAGGMGAGRSQAPRGASQGTGAPRPAAPRPAGPRPQGPRPTSSGMDGRGGAPRGEHSGAPSQPAQPGQGGARRGGRPAQHGGQPRPASVGLGQRPASAGGPSGGPRHAGARHHGADRHAAGPRPGGAPSGAPRGGFTTMPGERLSPRADRGPASDGDRRG